MLLSICIPTYERTACLNNCLNSIYIAKKNFNFNFEVCVSDNCSSEDVGSIIKYYRKKINIKYKRQKKNLGLAKNILSAVSMAKGKYSWIIGNDELLLPYTFFKLDKYLNKKNIDFLLPHRSSSMIDDETIPIRKRYSGGEIQKLSIIRATINSPKILLLDESTSAMDDASIINVFNFLNEYRQKNSCLIIIISHQTIVNKYVDFSFEM